MKNNKRFKITLNWYGELKNIWTHANSNIQAKIFALEQFAAEIGRTQIYMLAYFDGSKDNIKIEEV